MARPSERNPGFSRRAQYGVFVRYVVTIGGTLLAAALLAFSTLKPDAFQALRAMIGEATTPLSTAMATVSDTVASIPQGIADYFAVKQRNAALRKQVADSRALLLRARSLAHENRRLRALLRLRERSTATVVTARLVSSSSSSTRRFAVLNAGSMQGVAAGQPVQGPEGLIGRVLEVGPNSARVLLLSDAESIVPVRRTRDGLPAIAAGRGDSLIEIRSINTADNPFRIGDVLVTSGIGGIYGPNIPVGRIVSRTRDTALASTFAQPDSFDFALVERAFMPMPALHEAMP